MTNAACPPHASGAPFPAAAEATAPRWALLTVTWLNSLGSGILWSGVPFITERQFGFTERDNLLLALAESIVYVTVALASGPLLRLSGRWAGVTPRGWLTGVFLLQIASCLLSLSGAAGVVAAACALSAAGAALWPVMESYVSSGLHGREMRRSLGAFNVTWMLATGTSLLLMAPLVASGQASLSLLVLVPVSIASILLVRWFPAAPAPHAPEHAHTHIAPQYPYLLRASRFVIPTSYVFVAVLGPILPFLLRDVGLDDALKTPLASAWMFARMLTVVAMARLAFWHGRWSALALGVALLAGGFAVAVFAGGTAALVAGLCAFGAGHGIIYYSSIYYAMAVGGAEVDAGGTFEALIGLGYVVGPAAGLMVAGSASGLVGVTWGAALVGLVPAVLPWVAWHRRQAEAAR